MSQSLSERHPKYKKLTDWLRYQIENGNYDQDERLPSVRQLSRQFKVSMTTAQRALTDLEGLGIIYSVPRSGFFVSKRPQKRRSFWADFSGMEIQVNKDVVQMLTTMVETRTSPISSAVLGRDMLPDTLLRRCLVSIAQKGIDITAEYLPPPGHLQLRQLTANLMAGRGVTCGADDIIITSGDSVAMEVALWATGNPGDLVIIEEPTYFGILTAIEQSGFRAIPIATDPVTGIDVSRVEEVLSQCSVAAIFLNPTLQNPLGHTIPAENRKKLASLATLYDVTIIEDDVFADLHPENDRPPAIKSFDQSHSFIYCSSFSKTVSPGYRVGWCVPGKHYPRMMARMMERTISASSLPQLVLSEFLRRGYYLPHAERLRKKLSESAKTVTDIVREYFPEGTSISNPAGGFILWIGLPQNIDGEAFLTAALKRKIFLPHSSVFFADGREVPFIRVCYASSEHRQIFSDLILLGQIAHTFM